MDDQGGVNSRPQHVLDTALIDPTWILRRVESMRMDDGGNTVVRVSIDMLVDRERHPTGPGLGIVTPLTWAMKGPMTRLDVRVDEGHAHVLTTRQNAACVAEALVALGEDIVEDVASYRTRFEDLAVARPVEAEKIFVELLEKIEVRQAASPDAQALFWISMEQFIDKYILLVELHGVTHSRTTVKYAYDASSDPKLASDVSRNRLRWEVGAFGLASSTHVEVEVPAPLLLQTSELHYYIDSADNGGGNASSEPLARAATPATIHHLVAEPAMVVDPAVWRSEVLVGESTVTRTALFSAAASAALCAYLFVGTWGMRILGLEGLNVEPSTSLLLAAAGAIGPLLGRGPRHWLVAKFVNRFRNTTTWSGALLFLTAVAIGTMPAEPVLAWTQGSLLLATLVVLTYALASRRKVGGRRNIISTWKEWGGRHG